METIFALSSGRPPAAVSIIRISGPAAHSAGEWLAGSLPAARVAAVRELREPGTGALLDQALVLRFDGPSSATGDNVVELHCHGGRAVVEGVLSALRTIDGLREARPGEFTRRAFENGRIDLTEAEGLADLIEAETEAQRKAALALSEGALRRQIEEWRQRVLDLSARAERAIDYDDADIQPDDEIANVSGELAAEVQQWVDRPRVETLKDGVRVVIAGPPNTGKSSLLNAIAGQERAIVTDRPGTTRDHIEVPLALAGVPMIVTDTAGLRETEDVVEAAGVTRAAALAKAADILLWLGEPARAPEHPRLIRVHAMADRMDRGVVPAGSMPVSSLSGLGLKSLLDRVGQFAAEVLPGPDLVAVNLRQAGLLAEAAAALRRAAADEGDLVILAEELRLARGAFDRLTGAAGVEDLLDALFSRFCLGK